MPGPGEYRPDSTEGITRIEDLPKPKIRCQTRNYRRRLCPQCGHSAYRDRKVRRTLHDLGNPLTGRPCDRIVIYSQHYCTRCRRYFCRSRPGGEPFSRARACQLSSRGIRIDYGNADARVVAKVEGSLVEGQAPDAYPQIELVSLGSAFEAAKEPSRQIDREGGADWEALGRGMGMRREAGLHGVRWDDSQSGRARAPSEPGCAELGSQSTLHLVKSVWSPLGCRSIPRLLSRLSAVGSIGLALKLVNDRSIHDPIE